MNEETKQEKKEQSESEKIFEEKRRIHQLTQSEEWRAAKQLLTKKIILADSCSLIDEKLSNEQAGEAARVNQKVIKLISEWLQEIEGIEDEYPRLLQGMTEEKRKTLIFRTVE